MLEAKTESQTSGASKAVVLEETRFAKTEKKNVASER